MKLFIKNFFIFIVPICLFFVILELLVRDSNSLYKEKWEGYTSKADSIEVLILGNSHALNGINPKEFELFTYNIAFAAQSFYYDKAITLKNIKNMTNLKYVLISVDYHTFYYSHSEPRDKFYHYYYDIDYKDKTYFLEDFSWLYSFGFKQTIREHIPKTAGNLFRGYNEPSSTTLSSLLNKQSAIKRVAQLELDYAVRTEITNSMDDFIENLKRKGITPILITLPCHKFFKENLDVKILEQNKKDIEDICKKYGIEYSDFSNENYPDSLFYDLDHLNKDGAIKISKKINNMIMNDSILNN